MVNILRVCIVNNIFSSILIFSCIVLKISIRKFFETVTPIDIAIIIFYFKSWVDFSSNIYADPMFKFNDQRLKDECDQEDETVVEFFRLLALCHTVMVEEKQASDKQQQLNGEPVDQVG